jgi:hypothetical protein
MGQQDAMGRGPGGALGASKRSKELPRTAGPTTNVDEYEAQNRRLDEALIESFPASDPMAIRIESNSPPLQQRARKARSSK